MPVTARKTAGAGVVKKSRAASGSPARGKAMKPKLTAASQRSTRGPRTRSAAIKKQAQKKSTSTTTAIDAQVLAHALNGLLHTMQAIQQHEESLCSLMHALGRGRPSATLLRELVAILQQLPAHDYLGEVEALRDAVNA